jgi:G3E family GTPase
MKKDKIPVTIITGFLGAGKTTSLNHLIENHPATKFAIIENEFGDIPIDQELVINAEEGIFEMSNGCICCSLNAELGQLLEKLLNEKYNFDHLLIETTGIAEPDGIASAFIGPGRAAKFNLDGTICLVDAHNIMDNLKERGEALKQVTFADIIILNKTDLLKDTQIQEVQKTLKEYNPDARILPSTYGKVDQNILEIGAYDSQQLENTLLNPSNRHHNHEFVAHSFQFSQPLIAEKFEHWINMLLFLSGYQLYRIKGVLNIAGENHKVIFQSVRSNSKIDLGSPWKEGEARTTRIVFIGINIKKAQLEKGLMACVRRNP